MNTPDIPGYTYADAADSPVTLADLDRLKATLLFGDTDMAALRRAGDVLADQVEEILDVWYSFVGSHPFLLAYYSTPGGVPLEDYLARVRRRFGQWILDTCTRPYDAQWLAYQQEIALRHTSARKNATDAADSVPHIPLPYLIAFVVPLTVTIHPFLAAKGHSRTKSTPCMRPGPRASPSRRHSGPSRTPGRAGDETPDSPAAQLQRTGHLTVMPPSTTSAVPVTNDESSDARKIAAWASSSARPTRPRACSEAM